MKPGTTNHGLARLRDELDDVDRAIVDMLAERFLLTRKVGEIKRRNNLDPVDTEREDMLVQEVRSRAELKNLDPDLIERLYRIIIAEVVIAHRVLRASD